MSQLNHHQDAIMFGLFVRERTYATAPSWTASGCRMVDYDHNSAHAIWDDLVEDNAALQDMREYPTTQALVRQSVRLPYAEPRAHPNSLGGLLTLTLGQRSTTQDGVLQAYRHALTLIGSHTPLSMAAQVAQPPGLQYVYTGLKTETFTLRNNGAFLHMSCELLGSGMRTLAAEQFPVSVDDPWLLWGDCHIWAKDVTGSPLTLPGTPVQGVTNLGSGAVELSTRITRLEYVQPCHLGADNGYRPSSGKVRASLYPGRREAGLLLELDAESTTVETELDWYLLQRQLAFEWQCVGQLIQPSGIYRYGFTLLLPCLQFRALAFQEQDSLDTHAYEGVVVNDTVNPGVQAWVYTSEPIYLGLLGGCASMLASSLATSFLHCWDFEETSGNRVDHINGNILTEVNGAVGTEAGQDGLAATFQGFPAQRVLRASAPIFFFQAPFTVAFWTKLTIYPFAENATFIGNGASQNAGQYEAFINMGVFSHQIGMATRGGSDSLTHPEVISLGIWHLIVCWHTGSQTGIQIDNGTIALGSAISVPPAAFGLTIGGMGSGTYGLYGAMDVVMIWTRALTSQAERDIIWAGGA